MVSVQKYYSPKLLPVADLLLLNEFNGRQEGYTLSNYKVEEYGADYLPRVQELIKAGYLEFEGPEGALNALTIPLLKEILRTNNQKVSGNKPELVKRILDNISSEKYSVPKIYVATERGQVELETRWAYIENRREMYGFLNSEISALENAEGTDSEKILEKLFVRDIIKQGVACNFGLLRNAYFNAHKFFKNRGRLVDSVSALLSAIYFDLTGMRNNNTVESYSSMSYVFETSLWSELDKERTVLKLSDKELMLLFDDAVDAATKPSFSYFDIHTMKGLILERLAGQMDLLNRYSRFRNIPSEDNPNYNYFDISLPHNFAAEIPPEVPQNVPAQTKSGCFSVFLIGIIILAMVY